MHLDLFLLMMVCCLTMINGAFMITSFITCLKMSLFLDFLLGPFNSYFKFCVN